MCDQHWHEIPIFYSGYYYTVQGVYICIEIIFSFPLVSSFGLATNNRVIIHD